MDIMGPCRPCRFPGEARAWGDPGEWMWGGRRAFQPGDSRSKGVCEYDSVCVGVCVHVSACMCV